jgi:signal transduction histidine kinase
MALFLCNKIIRLHGGTMEIRSELVTGTEVKLFFPEMASS